MKSLRLFLKLFGIVFIATGLNSCKKDKDNDDNTRKCAGEDFTCTSTNGDITYTMRYCQDGWYAYYVNGSPREIYYDNYYTQYWNDIKQYWIHEANTDDYLTCVFN